jgi:copper(I)-binding protein
MRMRKAALAFAVTVVSVVGLAGNAWSQVTVSDAWVRGTVKGQTATGAFMSLKSPADVVLKRAESSVADKVEIHEMKMDGNVMRMKAVPQLELPAGKTVDLGPGGYHVMLTGLKKPLAKGDKVALKLHFEGRDKKAQVVEVQAEVRDLAATAAGKDAKPAHEGMMKH